MSSFREIELYSEQSLVIITAEEGPPQSEPDIVRAVAVDHTRISISWEPGLLKNGPILFYVLQIKEADRETHFTIKVYHHYSMLYSLLHFCSSLTLSFLSCLTLFLLLLFMSVLCLPFLIYFCSIFSSVRANILIGDA